MLEVKNTVLQMSSNAPYSYSPPIYRPLDDKIMYFSFIKRFSTLPPGHHTCVPSEAVGSKILKNQSGSGYTIHHAGGAKAAGILGLRMYKQTYSSAQLLQEYSAKVAV